MANILQVFMQQGIIEMHAQGKSARSIARAFGIDRKTVSRYLTLPEVLTQIGPPLATGNLRCGTTCHDGSVQNGPSVAAGNHPDLTMDLNSAIQHNPPSICDAYREFIETKLELGLTAVRIYQDLRIETSYVGGYNSVKRFVRKLKKVFPEAFRRMEVGPGEEVQVDFGVGAPVDIGGGKQRRPWLFRIVLSHSRKAYSEVVWHQSTESFIRSLENAFRYFGGVAKTLVTDNLKAAVEKADWYDPDLNPKLAEFATFYKTALLPCRPRLARHKGKVERCVGYAQSNALKGRKFESLAEENLHLQRWEANVADMRIHGTTRKQVKELFELERPHLGALPPTLFPCFEESRRKVHTDGHVSVANSYYSVPGGYVGHEVWARWDLRSVRVYNMQGKQLAFHPRVEAGKFNTIQSHISERKISSLERGQDYNLEKASRLGPSAGEWARRILKTRNVAGIRVVVGLTSLAGKHKASAIDKACADALRLDAYRLRQIKEFLKRQPPEQQLFPSLIQEHKLIRPISEYAAFVVAASSKLKERSDR